MTRVGHARVNVLAAHRFWSNATSRALAWGSRSLRQVRPAGNSMKETSRNAAKANRLLMRLEAEPNPLAVECIFAHNA
jgi:hypothetical protein